MTMMDEGNHLFRPQQGEVPQGAAGADALEGQATQRESAAAVHPSVYLSGGEDAGYEPAARQAGKQEGGHVPSPEVVEQELQRPEADNVPGPEEIEEHLPEGSGQPLELLESPPGDQPVEMEWYIVKVQSNREDSVRNALERKVKREGKEHLFGEIIVPEEKVTEFKNQRKRVVRRKLYPGYIVLQMVRSGSEAHEDAQMLVRSVPGIGDFVGTKGKGNIVVPTPLSPQEVDRIVARSEEKMDEAPRLKISFKTGDRVKITEGTFENFEGEVDHIDEANGRVTVMINIFGRSTPVELEYWQIESV
jgi:transcriptional antiterminator NusG